MLNSDETTPLPRFADPPVVETIVGIDFERLRKLDIPRFAALWNEISDEFPTFQVHPPLPSQIETFGKPQGQSEQASQIEPGNIRCWFLDADDRTLIQVQNNRFIYNWRKTAKTDSYPHYDGSIRPAFERSWKQFLSFVQNNALGEVSILQSEVTYVNHLEFGKDWESVEDLSSIFPCWSGGTMGEFLPRPENVAFAVSYCFPHEQGRLHISVRPAIRNEDGLEILQLMLSARGRPTDDTVDSLMKSVDLAREWVVRGFADFTSSDMHARWKREA